MSRKFQIDRRTALKGIGAAVGLPLLEAMLPSSILRPSATFAADAATGIARPQRMAFVFFPNGMIMDNWTPKAEGVDFELPPSLKPLSDLRGDINVISGLAHDNARAKGDGPGDHARCSAAFLTGAHPFKTAGKDIKLGISIDQYAASVIGDRTALPSLELGCDEGRMAGNCDSGYACAYVSNISWRSATAPAPKEVNPGAVFDRMFGNEDDRRSFAKQKQRLGDRVSILDAVAEDARRLNDRLGADDRHKLDAYTTSIREIEQRIERARLEDKRVLPPDGTIKPQGIPGDHNEHVRLMYDMMVVAFQIDRTRVATMMLDRAGTNRSFPKIGVKHGHHHLSHHRGDTAKIEDIKKVDRLVMEDFAYFLGKLKAVQEADGTLLDNSMILIGSGISDGNRHRHEDLPIVLAGRAGGSLETGRHVRYPRDTPLCNLFLAMLDRAGAPTERFGDSTGVLNI